MSRVWYMYSLYLRRGYHHSNVFIFLFFYFWMTCIPLWYSLCVYEEVEENLTVSVYVV